MGWWRLERAMGFEPTTPTLARLCSTPELRPRSVPKNGTNAILGFHRRGKYPWPIVQANRLNVMRSL